VKIKAELADLLERWGGPPPADTTKQPPPNAPEEGEEQ
jgi:hypothetical protein